jgi:uncharacterized C2H2 Zn-finger protein
MEQERKIYLLDIIPEAELESYIDYFNKGHWYYISRWQILSEEFIEKHSDKVDWYQIYRYQKLSEKFIRKHINKAHIGWLMYNENISDEVKEEIKTLKEII